MEGKDPESEDEGERSLARLHLDHANDAFDKFTDQMSDPHLGGRRLQQDRDDLDAMTNRVVRFANVVVAHADREPQSAVVTYDEFNAAIDHLGAMLKRYYLLIDQGGLMSATPTIQGDWRGPFRRPLA
jgi:hypothetical protein